jgi:hypothetical protein
VRRGSLKLEEESVRVHGQIDLLAWMLTGNIPPGMGL